jgi:hypothetical protein
VGGGFGLEGPVACFAKEDFCKCQPERLVVPNRYKNLDDEILLYGGKRKEEAGGDGRHDLPDLPDLPDVSSEDSRTAGQQDSNSSGGEAQRHGQSTVIY